MNSKRRLWKVSHGKSFTEEDVTNCLNDSYVTVHKNTGAKGVSSISQGKAFTDEVKPGDLFYLCRSNERFLLIGEFTSDPVEIDDEDWAWRKYKQLYLPINDDKYNGPSKWWAPNNNSTFVEIKESDYSDFEKFILKPFFGIDLQTLNLKEGENAMNNTGKYKDLLVENKNIILHGAPGTGKTYLAKKIAEAMGCTENEIGFVQFHPSYDYTDFVEGIRPNSTGSFDRINGIFKDFCADAIENINEYKNFKKNSDKKEVDVQELFSQYCTYIEKQIKESENKLFPFSNTMNIRKIIRNKQGIPVSIELATSLETSSKQNLSSNIFYRDYIDFKNKKIKSYQDVKPTYESKLKFHGNADYYFTLYQLVREFEDSNHFDKSNPFFDDAEEIKPKNFVFIIDEINRGELSKIFGELFFSIDPGYRGIGDNGKPKGLVKTQYQNLVDEDDIFAEGFYIPENVYIIGTMNDIDRSVESMDFAMRRRFIFEEVTAEESAENMKLSSEAKERMKRINDVIANTEGLNDAYKIGGSYFLNADDFDKLWRIKLSSLVKEYLRGIDDDGSKYQKIEDAYFNSQINDYSDNDE